jgi:DNA-binding PadR family transcriptional regulator
MPTAASWAGDFHPPWAGAFSCLDELLSQVHRTVGSMSAGHGPGRRGGPWDRGPGRPGGPRPWQWGGLPRPSSDWWPGPPGAPGTSRGAKAGRGDVRAAILAVLLDGPRNGYQIMSEIEERSGGAWRPSPGAVYPALSLLADEGLIEGEEAGGRRTFSLTDAGRAYVAQHPEMARGAWESMAQQEEWQLPGLFSVAARLGAGIVQVAHAGSPGQVHAAERLLEDTRRRLYQILAEDMGAERDDEQDEQ